MNRRSVYKHKWLWAVGSVLLILVLIVLCLYLFRGSDIKNEELTAATGESAIADFQDIAGESRIDELADVREAKSSGEAAEYLMENSVYVMDDEAIELYLESYITAAESTAQAGGVTV